MAVIQATTCGDHAVNPLWPRLHLRHTLEPALAALPVGAPIVIYVHGHLDWPHPKVLQQAREQVGLAITLNWPATARFIGVFPDVGQLYDDAGKAAPSLAWLINLLAELSPDRQIDLMAHSLGARVGLQALPRLKQGNLARFVGLAAVEFSAITLAALQAPVARDIAFYNVTTAKTALFHRLMHHFGPRPGPADGLLCRGFAFPRRNWIDIRLDAPAVRHPLGEMCSSLLDLKADMKKPALISQLEAVFLQNRMATSMAELRSVLGNAVPDPLSIIPLRSPPLRQMR